MIFKDWLFLEEIFPNKTATVFHRTKNLESIHNILSRGFDSTDQGGCMYGCGLYTTFDLRSQFTNYMERYGEYIVKFKVTNLQNYLIPSLSVAKYVLGKDYKISDQFNKRKSLWSQLQYTEDFSEYDKEQETNQYSSDMLLKLSDEKMYIIQKAKFAGAIYRGRQDGYCLLKYNPVNDSTITMIGYTRAPIAHSDQSRLDKINQLLNNQGWESHTSKESIKTIWQKPVEKREANLKDDMLKLVDDSKNNRLISLKQKLDQRRTQLNNNEFYDIVYAAKDKPKTLKVLMLNQELNKTNVFHVLGSEFENRIEIAKVLGSENIEKLSGEDILRILENSSNHDQVKELIDIILKYKEKLSSDEVYVFLLYSRNKREIASVLGEKNIRKLSSESFVIYDLIRSAPDKKEMAEILGQENINSIEPRDIRSLFRLKNKKEIAEILGNENIKKLTKHDLEMLFYDLKDKDESEEMKEIIKNAGL